MIFLYNIYRPENVINPLSAIGVRLRYLLGISGDSKQTKGINDNA